MDFIWFFEIGAILIHHMKRSRLQHNVIQNVDVMDRAIGDFDKGWDRSLDIQ